VIRNPIHSRHRLGHQSGITIEGSLVQRLRGTAVIAQMIPSRRGSTLPPAWRPEAAEQDAFIGTGLINKGRLRWAQQPPSARGSSASVPAELPARAKPEPIREIGDAK